MQAIVTAFKKRNLSKNVPEKDKINEVKKYLRNLSLLPAEKMNEGVLLAKEINEKIEDVQIKQAICSLIVDYIEGLIF